MPNAASSERCTTCALPPPSPSSFLSLSTTAAASLPPPTAAAAAAATALPPPTAAAAAAAAALAAPPPAPAPQELAVEETMSGVATREAELREGAVVGGRSLARRARSRRSRRASRCRPPCPLTLLVLLVRALRLRPPSRRAHSRDVILSAANEACVARAVDAAALRGSAQRRLERARRVYRKTRTLELFCDGRLHRRGEDHGAEVVGDLEWL